MSLTNQKSYSIDHLSMTKEYDFAKQMCLPLTITCPKATEFQNLFQGSIPILSTTVSGCDLQH